MNKRFYGYGLLALVFLTGAAVLIVEVVAMRILSPYYGNTLYTVSSVLGIILGALSFGYYVGGKIADKHPKTIWFFGIIFFGGVSILILDLLTTFALPYFGFSLSPISGPVIAALALFFVPAFLLGLLSPFAIVLQKLNSSQEGVGNIAGRIFFWSTVGSICGSLSTGFILIPYIGIASILVWVGSILAGIGFVAFIWNFVSGKKFFSLVILVCFVMFLEIVVITARSYINNDDGFLVNEDGLYEHVGVYEATFEGKRGRVLLQDRSIGGGIALDSNEHLFPLSTYYELYKIFTPETKRVLVVGGGPYVIPKAFIDSSPKITVDVAEIEPALFEIAQRFFDLPVDEQRLTNHIADGRRFLHDTVEPYDVIFGDAYHSLFSIPSHLTTQEFFKLVREKLSNNGLFIANITGSFEQKTPSLALSELKTFRSVFPNSYFFTATTNDSTKRQNIIFVGYKSERVIDVKNEVSTLDGEFFASLPDKLIDISDIDLSPHILLTDDYAPIEYLTAALVRDAFKKEEL